MRFKMDRLCELAGVPLTSRRGRMLREGTVVGNPGTGKDKDEAADHDEKDEGVDHDEKDEGSYMDEMYEDDEDADEGMMHDMYEDDDEDADEGMYMDEMYEDDDDDADEVVEIDEKELVQELRRARRIMQEGKRKASIKRRRRKQALKEAHLKAIIDKEVQNVLKEMDLNLNSSWMYGKRKPRRSRKGYTHQGSYLKGIGFK